MLRSVLIANRGAVAARIIRACQALKIRSVAVYSEADARAPYLAMADQAVPIGPSAAAASYLNQNAVLAAARETKVEAIHPGYGFLSENAEFAARAIAAGLTFIGPSPRWIEAMGHKTRARDLVARHGLSAAPGSPILTDDVTSIAAAASAIGYPVLVKPAGGGGGIGMIAVHNESQLEAAIERSRSMAKRGFANSEVYLEKLLRSPRHIEFQIVADRQGHVRHLFERDCSVQRRNQKVIEEAPAPGISRGAIESRGAKIVDVLSGMGYDNIGTIEMLMDADGAFGFLEMNTRLQVEHGVTEEVTGVDIVAAQIRLAGGEPLAEVLPANVSVSGHAIQARVYAEDPKRFLPSPGTLKTFRPPEGVRVETGYAEGGQVTPFYDPLVAKVIVHAADRRQAIARLDQALAEFTIEGIKTNIPALRAVLASEKFVAGQLHTGLLGEVIAA